MKIIYEDGPDMKVLVEHPNEKMQYQIADKIRAEWNQQLENFLEEVRVTIRTMENGTKIIKSKPLEITITKDDNPVEYMLDKTPRPTVWNYKDGIVEKT